MQKIVTLSHLQPNNKKEICGNGICGWSQGVVDGWHGHEAAGRGAKTWGEVVLRTVIAHHRPLPVQLNSN